VVNHSLPIHCQHIKKEQAPIIQYCKRSCRYLLTWKFLQDAIELFFSMIRSRFGFNDNPNAQQLKCAVRDILCMKMKDLITGNCVPQEESSTMISPLQTFKTIAYEDDDVEDEEEVIIPQLDISPDSAAFMNVIVVYIAGYTISKLCRSLACPGCICLLIPEEVELNETYLLILKRDNGGLCYPSKAVVNVCSTVESHVRFWKNKGLQNMKKEKVIESSLNACEKNGLISALDCQKHENHGSDLVKSLMMKYLEARLHHLARETTASVVPNTNRNLNKKGTHFAGN